jgi:hypothetical protein
MVLVSWCFPPRRPSLYIRITIFHIRRTLVHWRWRQQVPPKLHSVTSLKAAVRPSNFKQIKRSVTILIWFCRWKVIWLFLQNISLIGVNYVTSLTTREKVGGRSGAHLGVPRALSCSARSDPVSPPAIDSMQPLLSAVETRAQWKATGRRRASWPFAIRSVVHVILLKRIRYDG